MKTKTIENMPYECIVGLKIQNKTNKKINCQLYKFPIEIPNGIEISSLNDISYAEFVAAFNFEKITVRGIEVVSERYNKRKALFIDVNQQAISFYLSKQNPNIVLTFKMNVIMVIPIYAKEAINILFHVHKRLLRFDNNFIERVYKNKFHE